MRSIHAVFVTLALLLSRAPWRFGMAIAQAESPESGSQIETPTETEIERSFPAGETLSGRELYDHFLKNRKRLRASVQEGQIVSADPAGNPQLTRFWLQWKDYRDAGDEPVNGVNSKALVKLIVQRELRHTGYLYIHKSKGPDEQFMYSPGRQRITRVDVRGQSLAGTDFSFDDFLMRLDDLEDADYRRLPDETIQGVPCYVVEAMMRTTSRSRYSRSIVYLEKQHYVPLRSRYFDDVGVEAKELTSPNTKVKEFDGVWVPTESTMRDLLEETHSTFTIERLVPNPKLDDTDFSVAQLELRT